MILTLLEYAWIPVNAIYLAGMVLSSKGRLPDRWHYAIRALADLIMVVRFTVQIRQDGLTRTTWLVWIFAAFFALDAWSWWKHRHDDDDWGKRLKSWAKSHIPKPAVLQLRPGVGAA